MQLRNELREKEMKLTDIRLEALSSAHQLDQLREAMNRMQVCETCCTTNQIHWIVKQKKECYMFYPRVGGLIGGDREAEDGK